MVNLFKGILRQSLTIPGRIGRGGYNWTVLPNLVKQSRSKWERADVGDGLTLRKATLHYVLSNHKPEISQGAYSYKPGGPPLLYASCYAALIRHLYGDLDNVSELEREQWITHIQRFQSDDGLFRDPLIECQRAEEMDWWGWRHLTLHSIMALTVLGGVARKSFSPLEPFREPGKVQTWLETRNWGKDPTSVSNEIQNFGTMLQYARDFQGEAWCNWVLREMYEWLDGHQDPRTGLWGHGFRTPKGLSLGVQTGYHIWLLYFYDKRPIQHVERIIDSCLATQNRLGGFGVLLNSSACEDIDSIDPLVRLYQVTDYRKQDIRRALEKALTWILANRNPDGGWVFRRHDPFWLHDLMFTRSEESAMFPTWFRTLCLAYLGQVDLGMVFLKDDWKFVRCPGHQFFEREE